jgi:hypothetical protein
MAIPIDMISVEAAKKAQIGMEYIHGYRGARRTKSEKSMPTYNSLGQATDATSRPTYRPRS